MTGPGGIRIVPGRTRSGPGARSSRTAPRGWSTELGELESESDFVLVDAGSGLGPGAIMLAAAADEVVIVTHARADLGGRRARRDQPVPPAGRPRPGCGSVVNQARSAAEASDVLDRLVASSRQFLGTVVSPLGPGLSGPIPTSPLAVRTRRPFVIAYPNSIASRGVRRLARALVREHVQPQRRGRRPASSPHWPPAGP